MIRSRVGDPGRPLPGYGVANDAREINSRPPKGRNECLVLPFGMISHCSETRVSGELDGVLLVPVAAPSIGEVQPEASDGIRGGRGRTGALD